MKKVSTAVEKQSRIHVSFARCHHYEAGSSRGTIWRFRSRTLAVGAECNIECYNS